MDYIKSILEKNKSISQTTKTDYYNKISKIKKDINYKKDDCLFLNQHTKIIKHLKETYNKPSTLKSYFISLYSVSSQLPEISKKVINSYKKQMEEYREINNTEIKDNKPNEKLLSNKITFKDIKEVSGQIYNILGDLSNHKDFVNTELSYIISTQRKRNEFVKYYGEYILLSFLSYETTRLESYNVYFTKVKTKGERNNFILVKSRDKLIYYINDFKNVNKIGKQEFILSKELSNILYDYYEFQKLNKMFVNNKIYLFDFKSSNSFGQYIKRTFTKYFDTGFTINDLRHIKTNEITEDKDYMKLSINEKEKIHKKLLHNKNTGEEYIKLFK